MKVIVETETKLSKYLIADDVTITSTADNITVGNPVQFVIGDLNSTTVTITENVTDAPDDWVGNKYKLTGSKWSANADYVEPETDDGGE